MLNEGIPGGEKVMKAIEVKAFGNVDMLQLVDRKSPQPGVGEVVIGVKAIGVNPVETYIRAGTYPSLPALPYIPGGNVAGIIESCGSDVGDWQVGDRVYSSATVSGGYCEKCLCTVNQIFCLPEQISFSEGAAIGVPAATAWRALFIRGAGKNKEKVFVHGASGSVGQAAVQLAVGAGMQVFGTAGTTQGCDLVRRLGAEMVINHRQSGYEEELLLATGDTGFDLILEMLADKNLEKDLSLLGPKGRVIIIGSRGRIEIDPRATMGKETDIRGLAVFTATPEEVVQTHNGLKNAMEKGDFVPTVSREMSLADAPLAHDLVIQNGNCGKIVLIP
jgi:NADPH2:quinone reductase